MEETWPPGYSLLEHQNPYASSHHRQKSGGHNYKCRELSEEVERLQNELHLERRFQEVETLYREFLEESIREMAYDPVEPLQSFLRARDTDTYLISTLSDDELASTACGVAAKSHDLPMDVGEDDANAAQESRNKPNENADEAAARIKELKAITIIIDPQALGKLKRDLLRQQLDVRRELLKEEVIANTKLKNMKNKGQMLQAILASDKRYVHLTSVYRR
ncbi:hypothetical protein B0H13DRAFT_2301694 [Mycena leptocephala]|nr:hypothetical protein B0H13DRAFT_2301694 [Mycena leptocephala]